VRSIDDHVMILFKGKIRTLDAAGSVA